MKFEFTLPPASLRNMFVSLSLFLFFTSFISFNIYLSNLHKMFLQTVQGTLIDEFISGKPQPNTMMSKPIVEGSSKRRIRHPKYPNVSKNTSECTPFNAVSDSEPTTNYKRATNLPQWMKGTMNIFFFCKQYPK